MRKVAPVILLLALACTTATPPPPAPEPSPAGGPYGLTIQEEARILALEDRREYDAATVAEWVKHPNVLHRVRIALALGRIGPHTFVDRNGNREREAGETQAGVRELMTLAHDPEPRVREMAAFALGEIGDPEAAEALFGLTADADAGVAAEAVEALSKLPADRENLRRYLWMTDDKWPEGLRARAVRFLFRFEDQSAADAALRALASQSSAVRQEGAYVFARRPNAKAARQLELLMTDPNVLTRAYAAAALGRIGEAASAPLMIHTLGDVHPWVRTNAAIAIGRIAEKDRSVIKAADMPRILGSTEDPDAGVRASLLDALGYYAAINETARQRLTNFLKNGTRWERELATGAVMKHLGYTAFRTAAFEESPWNLVRLLENAGASRGYRDQYRSHPDPLVRATVLTSIPDDRVNTELETIKAGLTDADVIVRTAALDRYILVTTETPSAWLSTLQTIEEKERTSAMNDARISAIRAIAEYDRPQRALFLRGLLDDADPVIRRIAADLLVEKTGAKRPQYTPLPVKRTQQEYEEIARWARQPHTATIHTARGRIEVALLPQDAPITAWNFAQLAQKNFFANTSFMRVVPNFVIQGGDPRNDMNGGPGYAIRDEINLQKYTRGAVGMALSGADTGGSQFFITHSPQPHLDGGYTIFGRVYDGMTSVVDQMERGDRVERITIDERPPAGAEQVGSVPNVSLPLVVGPITAERILQTVPSYAQRRTEYQPDVTVLEMMKSYVQAGDRMEVYMGTWCVDSEREVPKLLRITDELKSQFGVDLPVTFVAVDRSKQQPAAALKDKHVQKVATFIYYRGDEELGRIEERPASLFEDDLLTILAKR